MTVQIDSETLKRLDAEGRKRGLSPRFLKFYRRLVDIQSIVEQHIGSVSPALDKKMVDDCVDSGTPLIRPDELNLDWSLVKNTFVQISATVADYPDLFGEVEDKLKEPESPTAFRKLIRAEFNVVGFPDVSMFGGTNELLLAKVAIFATLKPFLVAHSKALIGFVNQKRWRRGYCPICGGRVDFAFLDKEYGARWLVCSLCDAAWLYQRLQCPYCGNQDQNSLAYFTDDEGVYRLYVCEQCRTYLKAVDLRNNSAEFLLPLERLLTLNMDQQANEWGYRAGYLDFRTG